MNRRRKLIAGALALVPVTMVFVWAFGSGTAYESSELRSVMVAPQNKFGFHEALVTRDVVETKREPLASADAAASYAAEAAAPAVLADGSPLPEGIPPSEVVRGLPKIAYVYAYGYRLAATDIAKVQRRHADYCEAQGPRVCRILSLDQSGEEGDYAEGRLELAVAASRASKFGAELGKAVETAGGKEVSSSIEGEDLSKAIVDTEARLRARTLLRDRLMEVLATRRGTVAELVEAERGVAQVNEEIDEARSWLTEMQGRVEFSRVSVAYSASAPAEGGFTSPIRAVLGSLGGIFGTTIAALIGLLAFAGPFVLFGWLCWRLWKRFKPQFAPELEAEPA
jgi:hypothetical protein